MVVVVVIVLSRESVVVGGSESRVLFRACLYVQSLGNCKQAARGVAEGDTAFSHSARRRRNLFSLQLQIVRLTFRDCACACTSTRWRMDRAEKRTHKAVFVVAVV